MQGRVLLEHQSQAEFYFLEGSTQAAIEQLQIALKSGQGSFYELSIIESRLRTLSATLAAEVRMRERK